MAEGASGRGIALLGVEGQPTKSYRAGTANDVRARERGERARPLAEAGWAVVESRAG